MLLANVTLGNAGIFSCFFWLAAGAIAGTVATYVVRGRGGCIFGNFFLGLVGALIAKFVLGLVFSNQDVTLNFFETTVAASIVATVIAYLFHTFRRAESKYQQNLLNKTPAE